MSPDGPTRQAHRKVFVLAALIVAVVLIYCPYLTTGLRSTNDGHDGYTYQVVVADALVQCRAGVFPVYVGQSAWRYNGGTYPQVQAPLLTTAACALDSLTLRSLPAAGVLNALLVLAALLAATATYVSLLEVGGGRTIPAGLLALAFVACPGVLGLLFRLDMVMSMLALSFLPWVWLALWRIWNGAGWRASLLLGSSLALVLMGHPPIALWTVVSVAVAGVAGLIFSRRGTGALALGGAFSALAAAWPLALAFLVGGGRAGKVGVGTDSSWPMDPVVVGGITQIVREDWPAALLPVGWMRGPYGNDMPAYGPGIPTGALGHAPFTAYLQLGYALWAALFFSIWWSLRARDRRLTAWLCGVVCLSLFLFPVPLVTPWLWSHLPKFFDITRQWPGQRIYPILASLVAVSGALAWAQSPVVASDRPRKRWAALAVALAVWPLHEGLKFTSFALSRPVDRNAERVENAGLRVGDLQMSSMRRMPLFSDPGIQQRVLRRNGVPYFDNAAAVFTRCAAADPLPMTGNTFAALVVQPGQHLALCLSSDPGVALVARGPGFLRRGGAEPGQFGMLPLWTSVLSPQPVSLELADAASGQRAPRPGDTVRSVEYTWHQLPVRVRSLFPYRVEVDAPRPGLHLETSRLCVPGYEAQVGGRETAVGCSDDGYVSVPLASGLNEVTLEYVAPAPVRVSFWVSLITLLATVLVSLWRRPAPTAY